MKAKLAEGNAPPPPSIDGISIAFKAASLAFAIYRYVKDRSYKKELINKIDSYHNQEMAALRKIIDKLNLMEKDIEAFDGYEAIKNGFFDLFTPSNDMDTWYGSWDHTTTRDRLRTLEDVLAMDSGDQSYLGLFAAVVGPHNDQQSQKCVSQIFWHRCVTTYVWGQVNHLIFLQEKHRREVESADSEADTNPDSYLLSEEELDTKYAADFPSADGENGLTPTEDLKRLIAFGKGYIADLEDSYIKSDTLSPSTAQTAAGEGLQKFHCKDNPTTSRDPVSGANITTHNYEFSQLFLTGDAKLDGDNVVVGLQFVRTEYKEEMLGSKVKALTLRIHYLPLADVLASNAVEPSTLTIVHDTPGDDEVACDSITRLGLDFIKMATSKLLVDEGDDNEIKVVVGAGLHATTDHNGPIGFDRTFLCLKLFCRTFDSVTRKLTGNIEEITVDDPETVSYFEKADSDSTYGAKDDFTDRFSKGKNVPVQASFLSGAALMRKKSGNLHIGVPAVIPKHITV